MANRIRFIAKDMLIYGLGSVALQLFGFVTMPIYTRIFSPSEYGIREFIVTVSGFIAPFLGLGVLSGTQRYYYDFQESEQKIRVISTGFWFLLIWGFLTTPLMVFVSRQFSRLSFGTEQHSMLFAISLISVATGGVFAFLQNILRIQFMSAKYLLLSFSSASLATIFSLLLVLKCRLGLLGLFLGQLIALVLIIPVNLSMVFQNIRLTLSPRLLRDLLRFGVPLVPAALAYWIFGVSDRVVLGKLASLEQVGLYSVAARLTAVIAFAYTALSRAWSPHAYEIYTTDPHYPEIFGKMLVYVVIFFSFLAIGFSTFAREALRILATPKFYNASWSVGPLALGMAAYASTQITASGIGMEKKTKYIMYVAWFTAAINLGLNLLLIPLYGHMGAAIATMISYFVLTIVYYIITQRLHPLPFEKVKLLKIAATAIALVFGSYFLRIDNLLLAFCVKLIYCFAFLPILYILGVFGPEEIDYAKQLVTRVRLTRS